MSLWTPYLEEPMDLTKQKPVQMGEDWQYLEPQEGRSSPSEDPEYLQFERDALSALALPQHNPRMRRHIQSQGSDEQYRRQRQRNNAAAKMSRDRRKMRELRLGIQVAYLSKKLLALQSRLAAQESLYEPYTMYK